MRVIWFYGDAARTQIVCVRAFVKTSEETPPAEIPAAVEEQQRLFEALEAETLEIEEGAHLVRR
jgi:hypothetical protein